MNERRDRCQKRGPTQLPRRSAGAAAAALLAGILVSAAGTAAALQAQETLERTPNLPGGWSGQTGVLYANLSTRLGRVDAGAGRQLAALTAIELALGLPWNLLGGLSFAPQSPVVAGEPTEWEAFARYRPLDQAAGHGVDAATAVAWNGAAGSLDGELSLARWFGPVRIIGAFRTINDAYGTGDSRMAVAGGAVLHPRKGAIPVALVGDVAVLSDRRSDEEIAWSAGVQLGVSFTDHSLSIFATNTASPTIQGRSRGDDRVRVGLELTVPIPAARFVGAVVPREAAERSVVPDLAQAEVAVSVEMTRYLFLPKRIEVAAGSVVEWRNTDDVLHTVNAEDGAWRSGPIEAGERWLARFDRPGRYLYYCGPHPFMKGEVIVR